MNITTKTLWRKEIKQPHPLIKGAIFVDLTIAGIKSGTSITKILFTLSSITGNKDFEKIAQKILLGISWKKAYQNTFVTKNEDYLKIFKIIENNWEKGTSPIKPLEKIKKQLLDDEKQKLHENISKLSTKITLPLASCYLPSFIFLGLLPVIISSGGSINL